MASATQVEEKLRELIARLDGGDPGVKDSLRDSLPESRILSLHVTDLEADYWAELGDGRLQDLRHGSREDAEVRISVDSDDLVDMIDGRTHLFPAYLSGKIRIEASFTDMLQLRKML